MISNTAFCEVVPKSYARVTRVRSCVCPLLLLRQSEARRFCAFWCRGTQCSAHSISVPDRRDNNNDTSLHAPPCPGPAVTARREATRSSYSLCARVRCQVVPTHQIVQSGEP